VSDAVCHVRGAEASDAEAVADLAAGLAQSFPFYCALGYEESAVYFRKILGDQAGTCGG
jgi:hypothetical protein